MKQLTFVIAFTMQLVACGDAKSSNACASLCDELVGSCHFSAFPDRDSCLNGCGYSAELGSDIPGQRDCIKSADCNTFAVLECEHAFGQVE